MFTLQNKFQDSLWEDAGLEDHYDENKARTEAKALSKDSMMIRIIDLSKPEVIATFAAGKEV